MNEKAVIIFSLTGHVGHKKLKTRYDLFKGLFICGMRGFGRVEVNFVNGFGEDSGIRPAANGIGHFPQEVHALVISEMDIWFSILEIFLELLEGLGIMQFLDTVYFRHTGRHYGRAPVGITQNVEIWYLALLQIRALDPACMDFCIGESKLGFDAGDLLITTSPVLHGNADTTEDVV